MQRIARFRGTGPRAAVCLRTCAVGSVHAADTPARVLSPVVMLGLMGLMTALFVAQHPFPASRVDPQRLRQIADALIGDAFGRIERGEVLRPPRACGRRSKANCRLPTKPIRCGVRRIRSMSNCGARRGALGLQAEPTRGAQRVLRLPAGGPTRERHPTAFTSARRGSLTRRRRAPRRRPVGLSAQADGGAHRDPAHRAPGLRPDTRRSARTSPDRRRVARRRGRR